MKLLEVGEHHGSVDVVVQALGEHDFELLDAFHELESLGSRQVERHSKEVGVTLEDFNMSAQEFEGHDKVVDGGKDPGRHEESDSHSGRAHDGSGEAAVCLVDEARDFWFSWEAIRMRENRRFMALT